MHKVWHIYNTMCKTLTHNPLHKLLCSCHSRLLNFQLFTLVIILMTMAESYER